MKTVGIVKVGTLSNVVNMLVERLIHLLYK